MRRRPPRSTRTDTLCPSTTLVRASPNGEISLASSSDRASFTLDLDALPASIDRIVFTATHDDRPIAESRPLTVSIDQGKAEFNVAEHLSNEKAVMMIELYRHSSRSEEHTSELQSLMRISYAV